MSIDADKFMKLLAKILKTDSARDDDVSTALQKLDNLFRAEIPEALNAAGHPNAPGLSTQCTAFYDAMEFAITSMRLLDRPVVLLEGDSPSHALSYLRECAELPIPNVCLNTDCEIPILVVHGTSIRLETVNYANTHEDLNLENEYSQLLDGCREFQIELSRMLKYFILTMPLKTTAGTFLLLKKETENIFSRFIAMRFLVADNSFHSLKSRTLSEKYAGILCKKADKKQEAGKNFVTASEFAQLMTEQISIPVYGLNEEFFRLTGDILNHFIASIHISEKLIEDLTDDIIHMESSFSSANSEEKTCKVSREKIFNIATLREEAEKKLEKTNESLQNLKQLLLTTRELINVLLRKLEEKITYPRIISEEVLENIFKTFFDAVESNNSDIYEQAMLRLHSLGYTDTTLLKKYIRSKNGSAIDVVGFYEVACKFDELKISDWAKGKILIELLDIENAPEDLLRKLMASIKDDIFTGKEYCALALLESNQKQHKSLLMKSLQKGYAHAGEMLIRYISPNGEDALNMTMLLAKHLIPEACLAIGKNELSNYLKTITDGAEQKDQLVTINAPCLLYYKLAASQDSCEALMRIADILFDTSFKDVCFVDKKKPESQQDALMDNAQTIIWIANTLIEKRFETAHLTEISGITLFLLNNKKFFAEARKRLSSLKQRSAVASYCLGFMSEYGYGCATNFTSAIKYYKKALENGPWVANRRYVSERLAKAKQKLEKQEMARRDSYNEDEDYSSTSHPTPCSSSSCIVIAILGVACTTGVIRKMHTFAHREFLASETGKTIVHEYYRTGSQIMAQLNNNPKAKQEYEMLRKDLLANTLSAVQCRDYHNAAKNMINMQLKLCKKYEIEISNDLLIKLQHQFPDLEILNTEIHA